MSAVALIQRLHEHRAFVNRNLLAAASGLPDDALRRTFPIGQGSLWQTLLHLYAAEWIWLRALQGDENPQLPGDLPGRVVGNQQGDGAIASLMQLVQKWTDLQSDWVRYLSGITDDSLDDPVFKVAMSTGQGVATRRSDVLLHVCTHAHYTTAQAVNILRHLDVKPLPETMLISFARRKAL
ncbi:MAG: DinB family protein [Pirellulales bacterium]